MRPILGITLLGIVVIWILNEGTLLSNLSVELIVFSTLASMTLNVMNAAIIRIIVVAYQRHISHNDALHLSALGTLGNSAGGLPIGMTLKYVILNKKKGLKISEITLGLVVFAATISFFLLAFAAVSCWFINLHPLLRSSIVLLAITSGSIGWWCWWLFKKRSPKVNFLAPFLNPHILPRVLFIGLINATLFIASYWIVSLYLLPQISFAFLIFVTSIGLLTGLGTLLQTVGGIHELSLGVAAFIAGAELVDGLQLALTMRIAAILSSSIIVTALYLLPRHLLSDRQ